MARTKINLADQVEDVLAPSNIAQDASNRFVTDAEKTGWTGKASTAQATTGVDGLMSAADKTKLNGVEAGANAYTHPASHALSIITETATLKIMTDTERTKLAGVAANANNYVHPANHAATVITEDTTHRFATDAEKTTWNAKASTAVATGVSDGLMAMADKTKLDGVAANANNYVHPANHAATVITEDTTHRFATDAEKTAWNAKLAAAGGTITGDLTVSGNLTINGTTTSIDTVNMEIEDNILLLNKNQAGAPPTTLRSGIEVERGTSANALLQYNELTDKWEVTEDGTTFHNIAQDDDARFLTTGQKTAATRDATAAQNGLMSAAYATKLDGVAANANNYSLPTAASSTLGGVKVGTSLNINAGVLDAPAAASGQAGVIKYPQTQVFTGTGSQTAFTLSSTPGSFVAVYLGGLRQTLTDDYTLAGSIITFLSAPNLNQKIVVDFIAA